MRSTEQGFNLCETHRGDAMGELFGTTRRSAAKDTTGPTRTHTVSLTGIATFSTVNEMLRRFDAAIARDATIEAIVIDAVEIDGFEPGIPARVVQWLSQNAPQIRVAVLATKSPVLAATARASELLLPQTVIGVAVTRGEGQRLAAELVQGRKRQATGTRPSARGDTVASSRKASG